MRRLSPGISLADYFSTAKKPATRGGETPLSDTRQVYRRIRYSVRKRFETVGARYVRTFGLGPGMDYREALQVPNREEAEERARRSESSVEWISESVSCLSQTRPAICLHPETGELSWFNHVAALHNLALPEPVRMLVAQQLGDKLHLQNCYYGDGSSISVDVLEHINYCYNSKRIMFQWNVKIELDLFFKDARIASLAATVASQLGPDAIK